MNELKEFNQIVNKNVLNEISSAINSLHTDLLYVDEDTANSIIEESTDMIKRVVNCYIDEQKSTLLKLRTVL